jgi:hypothetical protein
MAECHPASCSHNCPESTVIKIQKAASGAADLTQSLGPTEYGAAVFGIVGAILSGKPNQAMRSFELAGAEAAHGIYELAQCPSRGKSGEAWTVSDHCVDGARDRADDIVPLPEGVVVTEWQAGNLALAGLGRDLMPIPGDQPPDDQPPVA